MRLRGCLTSLLIAAAAGTGLHFALGAYSPLAPLAETAEVLWQSDNPSVEQVADYWFHPNRRGDPGANANGNGTALALAIRLGRLEALRSGTQPVPERLRRKFKKHFPAEVLDDARWIVAEPGSRLGRILARWPVKEGAVTLGDVIVFKTQRAARDDGLFAHELAHVVQYRQLGISEFARRYAADPRAIEAEATNKARRISASSS